MATSIGNIQAVRIAIEQDAPIQFADVAQSPFFTYLQAGNNAPQSGGGNTIAVPEDIAVVEHEVWFEDVRSLQGKFDLIREFELGDAVTGRSCGGLRLTGSCCTRISLLKSDGMKTMDCLKGAKTDRVIRADIWEHLW